MRRCLPVLFLFCAAVIWAGERGERGMHPLVKKLNKVGEFEVSFADAEQKVIQTVDFRITGERKPDEVKAAVGELAALPEVTHVMLLGLAFTDESVAELGKAPKITVLTLYGT